MGKKNIVVLPSVIPKEKKLDKFGGWNWMEYSKKAWSYWCKKNGYQLVIYDKCSILDLLKYRVTVQRWFDIFEFLDNKNITYEQIAMIDACSIPKWNCPDFFELTNNQFTVGRETDNLRWVYESVIGYKNFFNDFNLDISKYFCSGFIIFDKSHREFFKNFKDLYLDNADKFIEMQTKTVKRGTCQTPLNYLAQINNIKLNFMPPEYRVSHLLRKDLFSYNWQLNEDKTPFFIKYANIWFFSGFSKEQRNSLMEQTWGIVKDNYE